MWYEREILGIERFCACFDNWQNMLPKATKIYVGKLQKKINIKFIV